MIGSRQGAVRLTESASVDEHRVLSEALVRFLDGTVTATPLEVLTLATTMLTTWLGDRGSCLLTEGAQARIVVAPHAPAVTNWPVDLSRYPEVATAIRDHVSVVVADVHADSRMNVVRDRLPPALRAVAAVPLVVGERCLGVILVQAAAARPASADEIAMAEIVARAATALYVAKTDRAHKTSAVDVPAIVDPTRPKPAGAAGRLLVVEDDDDQASALVGALVDDGYKVERARDGLEALRFAGHDPPEMILLDVNLPGLDGFSMATRLRESVQTRHVPVLFLSATDDLPTRVRAVPVDDCDFLPKPFSLEELLTRVSRSLRQARAQAQLRNEAERDELTGLGNLRLMRARLASESARAERYGVPLCMVVVDVDKLKAINDKHGHLAGSRALVGVADVLRRDARETDVPVRYGGDEFVVLLPHTTLAEGMVFARRASEHVARLCPGGIPVTVSIGVAALRAPRGTDRDNDLLARADAAAYRAKRAGGNRVCTDEDADVP